MAVAHIDFEQFHTIDLPDRLAAGNGTIAFDDVAGLGPLGLRLAGSGQTYTYVPENGSISILEGDEQARTVVELDQESWDGLAQDLDTPPGLLYGGRITDSTGNVIRFVEWEPAIRAMYHGRPIFDPDSADLRRLDGEPLDPKQTFTLDDDRAEMRHFLETTGFILVKDVFDQTEVDEMLAAAQQLRGRAREGDKKSWWGKNDTGDTMLCRVLTANAEAVFKRLHDDPRMQALCDLSEHDLAPRGRDSDEAVTVLWKNPEMNEGLSDIPWHRDCGMGGHANMCPLLIATICLTSGTPEAGELRVLPGSHNGSFHFIDGNDPDAPRGVSVASEAGSVSLHYGDVGHASMSPTSSEGPFRISGLMAFVPPEVTHHRGEGHYNDVLLDREDGQVEHLVDKMGRPT